MLSCPRAVVTAPLFCTRGMGSQPGEAGVQDQGPPSLTPGLRTGRTLTKQGRGKHPHP